MKLRTRLAVTAAGAMFPVVIALFWYDARAKHDVAKERLVDVVTSQMLTGRAHCEADPEHWGGVHQGPLTHGPPPPHSAHGPGDRMHPPLPPEGLSPPDWAYRPPPPPDRPDGGPRRAEPAVAYAYGHDFLSKNPVAPPIPLDLRAAIERENIAESSFFWPTDRLEILVRMPWEIGPCVYVLARGTTDASWGAILPENPFWLLPVISVLAAILLAIGPVVARIGRLTDAVRRSAANGYSLDVAKPAHGLADEIDQLAEAFDAASHEVRDALAEKELREKALREFVANTTHDVMIPLAVLQGHLSTLRERENAEGNAAGSVLVSAMNEAHYLASLIHNLAVAARLQSAHVALQRTDVDLAALIARVVARHRPIAKQLDIALESAVPEGKTIVSADVTLLEQAISNVTYNAVRYNRPGGHVAIVLEEAGEDEFVLRVLDDGPGIAPEQRSRMVERGYRGDAARTRAPDGQGLGLHIAFRAAELHGFTMTLQSSEAGGLEVVFAELKR
jgi:two-component system, OmpR family, sensor histidine kinase BaeS